MDRIENLESKFRFVHVAARRARQLQGGSRPLIPSVSRKPTRIAMEEVLDNAVQFEVVTGKKEEIPEEE